MLFKLQKYQVDVWYRRGTKLVVADALSQNFPPYLPSFENSECKIVQQLAQTFCTGWPDVKSQVSADLASFWDFRKQLTLEENLIFKNDKVVIPAKLTKFMLAKYVRVTRELRKLSI